MGESTPDAAGGRPIYFNGRFVPAAAAQLGLDDHGVLSGLGFFETLRTCAGRPHLWPRHQARLLGACARAAIDVPEAFLVRDAARLAAALDRLRSEHALEDAVFRYTITAGAFDESTARYTAPVEWLTVRPLPAPAPAEGVVLRVLELRRDLGEWQPRPKSLNFANALLGAHELRRRAASPHDEGLFLDHAGEFAVEATRHNLAWIDGDRWYFPAPALGAVAGTGLAWLGETGASLTPARARVDDLLRADAVVLINSVRGITPVRELWDRADRTRLGVWGAPWHPLLAEAGARWREALAATARDT